MGNARTIVVAILALVGLLNIGYGVYRMIAGMGFSAQLFVAAIICLVMTSLLWPRQRRKND